MLHYQRLFPINESPCLLVRSDRSLIITIKYYGKSHEIHDQKRYIHLTSKMAAVAAGHSCLFSLVTGSVRPSGFRSTTCDPGLTESEKMRGLRSPVFNG